MNRFGLSKHIGVIRYRPAASSTSRRFLTGIAHSQPELHSRHDNSAWAALLDPYLPVELRRQSLAPQGRRRHDIQYAPLILKQARARNPHSLDLLYYLGLTQKRWEAVMWLVKAILRVYLHRFKAKEELDELRAPSWSNTGSISLEQLSAREIWADHLMQPLERKNFKLEKLTEPTELGGNDTREDIGQIWQSLGYMILQAADLPEEDADARVILSHVFEILAHMHHINALPSTIYNYAPPQDPFVVQRPPTLRDSSFRIMTILADGDARNAYSRNGTPGTISHQQVRGLGLSIWLELILWSCIEGGWVSEAMWIVTEIDRRKDNKRSSWSVMRWDSPDEPERPQSNWSIKLEQAFSQSRMNQIAGGIGVAGHGPKSPIVHIPPHTISREVILALVDGLANTSSVTNSTQHNPLLLQQQISTCKRLLATEGYGLETYISNSIIVRLVGSIGVDVMREPAVYEQILWLSPTHGNEVPTYASRDFANRTSHELAMASSTVYLGLLHQVLYSFASLGDVQGTLRTFYRTQTLIDVNNQHRLEDSINEVTRPRSDVEKCTDLTDEIESLALHSRMPLHVLILLLDLATEAKLFDFGNCLLHSDDIHGPAIPPELYAEISLQPALLRYATVTADTKLQINVTEKLEVPLHPSVLQSLIYSHVELGNWSSVEKIFTYLRDNTGNGWSPHDIMRIASFILRMEKDASSRGHLSTDKTSEPIALLRRIFSGEFNSSRNPSDVINLKQVRQMNQLFRILKRCPGNLSKLTSPYVQKPGRTTECISIPVKAFNVLVEGVVESKGSIAAKELWDLWCHGISSVDLAKTVSHSSTFGRYGGHERVVRPNLQTLQTILRPTIQAGINAKNVEKQELLDQNTIRQTMPPDARGVAVNEASSLQDVGGTAKNALTKAEQETLEWGRKMFAEFGLSREEIAIEIPWYLDQSAEK